MLPPVRSRATHLGLHVFIHHFFFFLCSLSFPLSSLCKRIELRLRLRLVLSLSLREMDQDSKKAAKAFVDSYFPVKQPNPKLSDVLSDLFPPKSHQESGKKQGYEGGSSSSNSAKNTAAGSGSDWYSQGQGGKGQGAPQKSGNAVVFCEVLEACSLGSSVDYGCRDNYYPNTPPAANRQPGTYYEKDKDNKDGCDYPDPEHSRGEWWQGSLYY